MKIYNYNKLKKILTPQELYYAGYFEDNFTKFDTLTFNKYDLVDFANKNLKENGSIFVISGCFAPIHEGHFNLIDIAKQFVKDYSMTILYPAHDTYVQEKDKNWDIFKRIDYFNKNNTRTDVFFDTFPAIFYENDINFTYLISRVCNIFPNNKIYYIFGSDNYGFHLSSFENDFTTISVERQNCRKHLIESTVKKIIPSTIHISNNEYYDLSSTKIRNGF